MNSKVNEYKFAIFGKIIHTDYFVRLLSENKFPKPLVIVSLDEEYFRDKRLLEPHGLYSNIEKMAEDGLCYLYKMKTVNSEEAIKLFDQYNTNFAFSINCRNIIKKGVIDYFGGKVFNLHDSYLPDERGGALNTWRIMNGIDSVGNTIHYLDEGIDTGDIVVQKKTKIYSERPESIDYLKSEKINCEEILSEFIELIKLNQKVPSSKQENDKSFYYPRLFTEINGIIDWDWDINSIERFVRAFSSPYPGAYTFINDTKIHILKCSIDEEVKESFHPFANGKIVTVLDNNDVRVIAGGKALILKQISVDGRLMAPGEYLSVKYTLSSPMEFLARSRQHVPTTLSMNKKEKQFSE